MPADAAKAVEFMNSEKNPLAKYLASVWNRDADFSEFSNEFVYFRYPSTEWAAGQDRLEVKIETRLGVNIRIFVELLERPMESKEYCLLVNELFRTDPRFQNVKRLRCSPLEEVCLSDGHKLMGVYREWEIPTLVQNEMVEISLRQFSLHGTSFNPKTEECLSYNCTISSGAGIWNLFDPIFQKFLSHLRFGSHEQVATACRKYLTSPDTPTPSSPQETGSGTPRRERGIKNTGESPKR